MESEKQFERSWLGQNTRKRKRYYRQLKAKLPIFDEGKSIERCGKKLVHPWQCLIFSYERVMSLGGSSRAMMLSGSFLPPPTFPLYLRFIGHTRDSISLILTTPIQQLGYTYFFLWILPRFVRAKSFGLDWFLAGYPFKGNKKRYSPPWLLLHEKRN